jgi:amino acid transporter
VAAPDRDDDANALASLGYTQELFRGMGGFTSFALSFSIISILTGAVTLYGHGLVHGGPLSVTLGWPVVTLLTLPIALSLAELASAIPTAGALYHWSAMLGGRGLGFFTAWLNTIGQFAITAGIDYGLAGFVVELLGLPDSKVVLLSVYAALLVSHAALNHVGVRVVALLNWVSAFWHVLGVIVLAGAVAFLAPHQPASFLVARHAPAGMGAGYAFLVGLLQAAWTFTGYDASAHATEETHDPSRNAPRGILTAVVVSGIAGYLLLLAVTLAVPDLEAAAKATNPFIAVLRGALGERLGDALTWMVLVAMWFCGLASVTSNSRMLWAFARDGGLPASRFFARVSPRFRVPAVAIWTSVAAAFGVAVWADAYAAVTALSTLALYASYALPIVAAVIARRAGRFGRRGPFHLGRWSGLVNGLAIAWVAVATVLFVLPPNDLAGETFALLLALLAFYWLTFMRTRFPGPKLP